MAKPTALGLVRDMLQQSYIVDVRRGKSGMFTLDTVIDSPAPLQPGRYHMLDDEEYRLLLSRVAAAEASMQLTRLMRKVKRTGLPPKRTR